MKAFHGMLYPHGATACRGYPPGAVFSPPDLRVCAGLPGRRVERGQPPRPLSLWMLWKHHSPSLSRRREPRTFAGSGCPPSGQRKRVTTAFSAPHCW